MIGFYLSPYDVLFFGGGKSFNIGSQDANSVFPPLPSTCASSICSKIFSEKRIGVSKIIKNIYGPFFKIDEDIILPKPLDILVEKKKDLRDTNVEISSVYLLQQGGRLIKPQYSDLQERLGGILWQKSEGKDFEVREGFIKLCGFKKWFHNQQIRKEDLISKDRLFEYEHRIGIKMDYSKNTTREEDALYRIDFIRFKDKQNQIQIAFFVEFDLENQELAKCGLDKEEKIFEFFKNSQTKVLKFGGEMRSVSYECELVNESVDQILGIQKPQVKKGELIKILCLTPSLELESESYRILCGAIRVKDIGINSTNYGNKATRAISEGSVIYAEVLDEQKIQDIWLKPKDGEFIGCSLRVYTKISGS